MASSSQTAARQLRATRTPPQRRRAGPASRLEQLLHQDDVDPFAIQHSLLAIDPDRAETAAFIEGATGSVIGKGREHQLVIAERASARDQGLEQGAADTAAARGALDIEREIPD